MKPSEILKQADWLLATKGWSQGSYAKDDLGNPCHYLDKGAVSFCLLGAINKGGVNHYDNVGRASLFVRQACDDLYDTGPLYVNDRMGRPAVNFALKEAIRLAEEANE